MTEKDQRYARFDTDGDLENILFELEVKSMEGKNSKSENKFYKFKALDFDWKTDPYMPTLDITNKIEVLGDYFSDSESDKRVITTFRMYADYESLINGAFTGAKDYFTSLANDNSIQVDVEKCAEYASPVYKGKGMLT
jgi:hypothetical protein